MSKQGFFSSLFGFMLVSSSAFSQVWVNFSREYGPILHSATGIHGGFRSTVADSLYEGMQISCVRRPGTDGWTRAAQFGATVIQILGAYGTENDWPACQQSATNVINDSKQYKGTVDYHYDVWNEPNYDMFWTGTREQFFERAKLLIQLARQLDPDALICAPSIGNYDEAYLKDFLLFCRQNNCLPDILGWHEMAGGGYIDQHAEAIGEFIDGNGMSGVVKHFEVNEFEYAATYPAIVAEYFGGIEKARIKWAAKGYNSGIGENPNNLNGLLLGKSYSPSAAWWAYERYTHMRGIVVGSTIDQPTIFALATKDATNNRLYISIGCKTFPAADATVTLNDLSSTGFLDTEGTVICKMEKMRDNEPPLLLFEEERSYSGNQLTIPFATGSNDGFYLEVSIGGSTPVMNLAEYRPFGVRDWMYRQEATLNIFTLLGRRLESPAYAGSSDGKEMWEPMKPGRYVYKFQPPHQVQKSTGSFSVISRMQKSY